MSYSFSIKHWYYALSWQVFNFLLLICIFLSQDYSADYEQVEKETPSVLQNAVWICYKFPLLAKYDWLDTPRPITNYLLGIDTLCLLLYCFCVNNNTRFFLNIGLFVAKKTHFFVSYVSKYSTTMFIDGGPEYFLFEYE